MKSTTKSVMLIFGLCLAVTLTAMMNSGDLWAEDVDIYRTSAKPTAMMVIDTSGSMSWPIYDGTMDYARFMWWMRYTGEGDDDDNNRKKDKFWDADNANSPHSADPDFPGTGTDYDYDRLDPNRIYLVSSVVGHDLIQYKDSEGIDREVSAIGDVAWKTNSNNDADADPLNSGSNYRDDWLKNVIIEVHDITGLPWTLDDGTGNPRIDTDVDGYVVYPQVDKVNDICDNVADCTGVSVTLPASYAGQTLANAQKILMTDETEDPRTGETVERGFVGFLQESGFYFSGLFEKSGAAIEFTDTDSSAQIVSGKERVYIFATGRWLNYVKLAEDFENKGSDGNVGEYNYSFQQSLAWINVCDKSNYKGGEWVNGRQRIRKSSRRSDTTEHNQVGGDINPPDAKSIKIHFKRLNIDICNYPNQDFVEFRDGSDVPLFAMKGSLADKNNIEWADSQTDDKWNWQTGNPFDGDNWLTKVFIADKIKVFWHHEKNTCGHTNYTRVFWIDKYMHSDQVVTGDPPGEWSTGVWTCSNGNDGRGYKMKPRIEVARSALKRVVNETGSTISWGLTRYNGSDGGTLLAQLDTDTATVVEKIKSLRAGGSTPMGEAMQDGYDSAYDYFENAANADAECADKFMLTVTDGFPTNDTDWTRVSDKSPNFSDTAKPYVDNPNDYDNHSDDVAYWMFTEATHRHTTHAIGFGLDNPLLGDIADRSTGLYLTAYSEAQMVNAIYSISLAMADTTSFVAPVVSVDQANRTQSGKNVYTAFFRPAKGEHWTGNLKKYGIELKTRYECNRFDAEYVLVDQNGKTAVDCFGNFYATSTSFFSTVPDGGDAARGGVGEVLKNSMPGSDPIDIPGSGPYYDFRNIFTYDDNANGDLVPFVRDNLNNTTGTLGLGVADDLERYKIVNFIYGYTYDAEVNGDPKAKRAWTMGDVIHSEPTVLDYLDQNNATKHRLIVVGANDGMLHVFVDDIEDIADDLTLGGTTYDPGSEVMAFVPPDLLTKLQDLSDKSTHHYFVDGFTSFHRARTFTDKGSGGAARGVDEYYHKTLVFGERRGGNSYWALDVTEPNPADWKVKWHIQGGGDPFSNPYYELQQTWSKPIPQRIQMPDDTFKDVLVFAGGYDPEEDNYPEVWVDDGTDPPDGRFDSATESPHTDTPGGTAGTYDYFNPDMNEYGRGIYVVDLETGDPVFRAVHAFVDVEATEYGAPVYGFTAMKWSFPADTTVIPLNLYRTTSGPPDFGYRKLVIYVPDVYGTIWKVIYDYSGAGDTNKKWQVRRIFSANPGSNQVKALDGVSTSPSTVSSDWGRKMFYPPDVSYLGTSWSDYPTLYVGTGDRPHPRYVAFNSGTGEGYHDRFYVVADSEDPNKPGDDATYPLNETYLLNLTCDELENVGDVDQDGLYSPDDTDDDPWRAVLRNILFHYGDPDCSDPECDYPVNGQYARGWYRIIGKQGDCSQDSRDHEGEKVLSRPTVFAKVVYFTTFQPTFLEACNPSGDALIYALDYDVGTSAFNLNLGNDDPGNNKIVEDLSDTYSVVQDSTIASGVRVITRGDKAAGVFSAGGAVVGAGDNDGQGKSTTIPGPPGGASKIMWETD